MKNILYGVLAAGLLIGTPASLLAQDQTAPTEVNVIDRETRAKDFSSRLEEARKKFEDKISDAKERRIAVACKAAQTKIGSVLEKAQSFQARHSEIHQKWLAKLIDLSARIAAAGIDTTTLDGYVQELNALIAQNSSDLENYITALENVSTLDCEADAAAFYSALQSARAARSLVVDDTKAILAYIRANIKIELQNIKQQLEDNNQSPDNATDEVRDQATDGGNQ